MDEDRRVWIESRIKSKERKRERGLKRIRNPRARIDQTWTRQRFLGDGAGDLDARDGKFVDYWHRIERERDEI